MWKQAGRLWPYGAVPPWVVPVALYVVALGARFLLIDSEVYGDEAAHFFAARHLGNQPIATVPHYTIIEWIFWQRPAFSVLLWPAAQFGFTAYRVGHLLFASALPVLVYLIARRADVRIPIAATAGLLLALHPEYVLWGVRVFPDTLMSVLLLAAVLAWLHERPIATAVLALAAVWTKEVAALGLVALWVASAFRASRRGEFHVWPVRMDKTLTALLVALVASPLALYYSSEVLGGRLPGWSTAAFTWHQVNGYFLSLWLAPLVAVGLAHRRTRGWALLALVYPTFYLVYQNYLGGGVEPWYLVLPGALTLIAATVTVDEWWTKAGPHAARWLHAIPRAAGSFAALAVAVIIVVPAGMAVKTVVEPAAEPSSESLFELNERLEADHDLDGVVASLTREQWEHIFLIDVGWFYIGYPFGERAGFVGWAYAEWDGDVDNWIMGMEELADALVLAKSDKPLNRAIREVYADCTTYENPTYVVIDGQACSGRGDELKAAHARFKAGA